MFKENYGFGLGVAVVVTESQYGSIPCAGSVGSVGWPGAYGGWWSADPVKKTISIFLTHSMTERNNLPRVSDLNYMKRLTFLPDTSTSICK